MKTNLYSLIKYGVLAVMLPGLVLSCAKENEIPADGTSRQETLVSIRLTPSAEQTKSFLDETSVKWEEGDALALCDAVGGPVRPFNMTEEGVLEDGSASFEGEVDPEAKTFWVVYPQNAAGGLAEGDVLTATLPSTQYLGAANTSTGALVAIGKGSREDLALKNVFSLVKVTVSLPDVASVILSGTAVAGTAGFDAVTGELGSVSEASDVITFLPREGEEVFAPGDYFIAVLPGSTGAGDFSVTFNRLFDEEGGLEASSVLTSSSAVTFRRNKGFTLNDAGMVPSWAFHIDSREKLFAWNAQYAKWSAKDVVYLDADIDMACDASDESTLWTPHTFPGTFQGCNHNLYHIVTVTGATNTGLFSDLCGSVSNLVIGSSDGQTWDGVSHIRHAWANTSAWANIGSVCGRLRKNSSVSGVTNFAKVEILSSDEGKGRLGGIAGFVGEEGVSLSHCTNHGTLLNSQASACAINSVIGGIVASAEDSAILEDCLNTGSVTSYNANARWIGGIMGCTNGRAAVGTETDLVWGSTLTRCYNEGAIAAYDGPDGLSLGGIVGYLSGGTLETCENRAGGSITYAGTTGVVAVIGGVAGRVGTGNDNLLKACFNRASLITDSPYVNRLGGLVGQWSVAASYAGTEGTACAENCINDAVVANSSTENVKDINGVNVELRVGGLVATVAGQDSRPLTFRNCSNKGAVSSVKPSGVAGYVGGICGWANYTTMDACSNSGSISSTNTVSNQNVGGLLGYGSTIVITSSDSTPSCNTGEVAAAGSTIGYVGGLVGSLRGTSLIDAGSYNNGPVHGNPNKADSCFGGLVGVVGEATAQITIEGSVSQAVENRAAGAVSTKTAQKTYVGGIVAHVRLGTVTVKYARNSAPVSKAVGGHSILGGILGMAGYNEAGNTTVRLENCVNAGTVTDNATATNLFRWAGGIVGRTLLYGKNASSVKGEIVLSGCRNEGAVSVTLSSNKTSGVYAAGIVAGSPRYCSIEGCSNSGSVSFTNKTAGYRAYAGGIFGGDADPDATADGSISITASTNTGDITAVTAASTAGRIGAGGIAAHLSAAGCTLTGNFVSGGTVVAKNGTTVLTGASTTGGSGAVVGDAQAAVSGMTATVSKSVTVGNTSWASASSAGMLAAWLCPNNSDITVEYVD